MAVDDSIQSVNLFVYRSILSWLSLVPGSLSRVGVVYLCIMMVDPSSALGMPYLYRSLVRSRKGCTLLSFVKTQ